MITKKRLYLDAMESIFNSLDDVTIIDSAIKGVLPVYSSKEIIK